MYLERITWGWSRQVGGRRAAAIPVAAGLGAHQPDWRLRLAAEPQAGGREVQAATIARKTLAYDFFRIQRAPHLGRYPVRAKLATDKGHVMNGNRMNPVAWKNECIKRHYVSPSDFCRGPADIDGPQKTGRLGLPRQSHRSTDGCAFSPGKIPRTHYGA